MNMDEQNVDFYARHIERTYPELKRSEEIIRVWWAAPTSTSFVTCEVRRRNKWHDSGFPAYGEGNVEWVISIHRHHRQF